MSILVDRNTQVVILGITGRQGQKLAREMRDYGTRVVAGVTPDKGGESVDGVPVYHSVAEAVDRHPEANACLVSVPRTTAKEACQAAIESGRFQLVNVLTEGIPCRDAAEMVQLAEDYGVRLLGPASIGIIAPAHYVKIGAIGGSDPGVFYPGQIAVFSKSGGMTLSIASTLFNQLGFGVSVVAGLGGDRIIGTNFVEALELVRDDPETSLVILNGEVGGSYEEDAAQYLTESDFPKRVIARLTGVGAEAIFPAGSRLGHAGAIVGETGTGTYDSKVRAFEAAGVPVAKTANELVTLVEREMPRTESELDQAYSSQLELVSISKKKLESLKAQVKAVRTKTSLTDLHRGTPYFRGYALPELMRKAGIREMQFMAIKRQEPTPESLATFKKIATYCYEHLAPPDYAVQSAVTAYRKDNPLNAACAAGLLDLPEEHPEVSLPQELSGFLNDREITAMALVVQTTFIVADILGHEWRPSPDMTAEEMFFRSMSDRMPLSWEADLVRAAYIACVDHTPATPSSLAGIASYSGGNSLKTALAAAITAMGSSHAGAGEGAAQVFQAFHKDYAEAIANGGPYAVDGEVVHTIPELARYIVNKFTGVYGDAKRKIPGYGHRYYGSYGTDPRAAELIKLAREHDAAGPFVELAIEIERVLKQEKSPALCLNVDGAIGAVISEMKIDWHAGRAAFIIPRTVGVLGELLEQHTGSFLRLDNESTVYTGPELGRAYVPVRKA